MAAPITARMNELTDTATQDRTAWMSVLGQQSADPMRRDQDTLPTGTQPNQS